jgi:WD40 repeat protein
MSGESKVNRPNHRVLRGHTNGVESLSWNGKYIVSGSNDNTVRVWDVVSGQCVLTLEKHTGDVRSVSWHPGGTQIVSGSRDNTVRVWDVSVISEWDTLRKDLASLRVARTLPLTLKWNLVKRHYKKSMEELRTRANALGYTLVGYDALFAWCQQGVAALAGNAAPPSSASASDGSSDQAGFVCKVLGTHTTGVYSVSFSPDGARIVSGSWDETVKVWSSQLSPHSEALLKTLTFPTESEFVDSVSFSPDGARIVSGSMNGVRVWDAESGQCVLGPLNHSPHEDTPFIAGVMSVSFSPDGARLVSGSSDQSVRVWDASTGESLLGPLFGHTSGVMSVSWHPDGKYIVSGSNDNTVKVWDTAQNGQCVLTLREHTNMVRCVSFSPDGTRIVSGSWDRTIRVWDVGVINDWDTLRTDLARVRISAKTLPTTGWDLVKRRYKDSMVALRARADALGYTLVGYDALLEWLEQATAALAGQDPVPPPTTKQKTQLRL